MSGKSQMTTLLLTFAEISLFAQKTVGRVRRADNNVAYVRVVARTDRTSLGTHRGAKHAAQL